METTAHKKRYFTINEANQRLPLVRAIVKDIVDVYQRVVTQQNRLEEIRAQITVPQTAPEIDGLDQLEEKISEEVSRLEEFCDELLDLGVELKDPVMGLVDFRTMVDGREAYFCWKLGEQDVSFWHELHEGFSGRKELCDDFLDCQDALNEEPQTLDES